MYAGIDVGGTKTLAAVLDDNGTILEQSKFPTPQKYDDFISQLANTVASFATSEFTALGVALPVTSFDRQRGIAHSFGNLPWRNEPVQRDFERLFSCPVVIENDAKLGGLSEAMLLKDKYQKVLYITVSTGIGTALIVNQTIDTAIGDAGGRLLLLEYKGKLTPWEKFASGKAIVERFGHRAEDIHDAATWKRIAHDLALGFIELIALLEPEIIVVGGSVGTYYDRYSTYLAAELKQLETPLLTLPPIIGAQRPEEAVVYGCYDLAKATYGTHTQPA
ncbi:MAG TPA: ROK family protein [Candidatus Saccharimonadales bacterium]|nr:ROK family protein [Candidatus Saccharimonadales bacterium]